MEACRYLKSMRFAAVWLAMALMLMVPAAGRGAARGLTDADCEDFGRELEQHLVKGDMQFYAKAFDIDALLRRAMAGHSLPKNWAKGVALFEKGFNESFNRGLKNLQGSRFLRVRHVGNEQRILMRIYGENFGLNYHELIVAPDARNKVRIIDAFFYSSGERISETLKRQIVPILLRDEQSLLEKIFSQQPDLLKYEREVGQMVKLLNEGKNKEVMTLYARLPASLQNEKFVLTMRLRASASSQEYISAITAWRSLYPKDPSIDLMSIDLHVHRQDYGKAIGCLERLDKAIGGDPFLDYQRAELYRVLGHSQKASEAERRGQDREMGLAEGGYARYSAAPGKVRAASKDLKLQGIMYSGARSSATINGKFVMVGDSIENQTVLAIEQTSVTLQAADGAKRVLKLEGAGL